MKKLLGDVSLYYKYLSDTENGDTIVCTQSIRTEQTEI